MALALGLLYMAARKATPGVPGKFQCAVEMLVDMVSEQAKSIVHGGQKPFIAPFSLDSFVWVAFMNAIDLIPVDFVPRLSPVHSVSIIFVRFQPLTLNGLLGIACAVY